MPRVRRVVSDSEPYDSDRVLFTPRPATQAGVSHDTSTCTSRTSDGWRAGTGSSQPWSSEEHQRARQMLEDHDYALAVAVMDDEVRRASGRRPPPRGPGSSPPPRRRRRSPGGIVPAVDQFGESINDLLSLHSPSARRHERVRHHDLGTSFTGKPEEFISPEDEAYLTNKAMMSSRLDAYGLAELEIEPDGNCQFAAISDQLYRTTEHHGYVRRAAIDYIRDHEAEFADFLGEPLEDYCQHMSRQGTWGDHLCLKAVANALFLAITLITTYKDNGIIEVLPDCFTAPARRSTSYSASGSLHTPRRSYSASGSPSTPRGAASRGSSGSASVPSDDVYTSASEEGSGDQDGGSTDYDSSAEGARVAGSDSGDDDEDEDEDDEEDSSRHPGRSLRQVYLSYFGSVHYNSVYPKDEIDAIRRERKSSALARPGFRSRGKQ